MTLTVAIVDLRSGAHKSASVPPKRPYDRKMVVHTPNKLDSLRQAAAARRAHGDAGNVPPSVRAAGLDQNVTVRPAVDAAPLLGDFLDPVDPVDPVRHADHPQAHAFDLWDGDIPPSWSFR